MLEQPDRQLGQKDLGRLVKRDRCRHDGLSLQAIASVQDRHERRAEDQTYSDRENGPSSVKVGLACRKRTFCSGAEAYGGALRLPEPLLAEERLPSWALVQ